MRTADACPQPTANPAEPCCPHGTSPPCPHRSEAQGHSLQQSLPRSVKAWGPRESSVQGRRGPEAERPRNPGWREAGGARLLPDAINSFGLLPRNFVLTSNQQQALRMAVISPALSRSLAHFPQSGGLRGVLDVTPQAQKGPVSLPPWTRVG